MHTVKVFHKFLIQSLPSIHAARLKTFVAAVEALTLGAKASVTSLILFGRKYECFGSIVPAYYRQSECNVVCPKIMRACYAFFKYALIFL